jgi:hypothetical protein
MAITDKKYYNPSVNIKRDLGRELNYVPTPNSKLIFSEILKQYKSGTHSFTLIGAYGTGKSSFLLAFEQEINIQSFHFSNDRNKGLEKKFEVIPFVGEYSSLISSFAKGFGISDLENSTVNDIIIEIEQFYSSLKKKEKGLAIFIDEFGKFLEYATKNNPEAELYFIQQLAELSNDSEKDILLITTLHQGFNSYSRGLTRSQQQEWDKVRGRLSELNFNEPVEQLLLLASMKLDNNNLKAPNSFDNLFKSIEASNTFPLRDYLDKVTANRLFPFDILSAAILTLSLQRYGQNQRSLFSFIDSDAHLSLSDFNKEICPYYNIANVYDYLMFNYYSNLSTKYNPDYSIWSAIRNSIERVELLDEIKITDAIKLIKTIGLLQIFANKGALIDISFLECYASYSLGVTNSAELLSSLEQYKIIAYSKHSKRYKLLEGTDLNIELAIDEAGNLVQKIGNVVDYLNRSFDFPYLLAKESFYEYGTPRYFGFNLSEEPESIEPKNEVDGYVNLIFSENYSIEELHDFSGKDSEAILYGWYSNTKEIKKLLFEIEKIKKAIEVNKDDKYALKEFKNILAHQKKLLNHYILDNLYSGNGQIQWSYNGRAVEINNQKEFNKALSRITFDVYTNTPKLKNELINKTKISSAISVARRNLLNRIIENSNEENLGFTSNQFPPEKTIYLTLLKDSGIHKKNNNTFLFSSPSDDSFSALWNEGVSFINRSKAGIRKISDFVEILGSKPYKLKQGLIDFWLPIFLFIHSDKYALYGEGKFIPQLSTETLELIIKRPDKFEIKAFDIEGKKLELFNKYRLFLNQVETETPTTSNFIEIFRPFISFYKSLSTYSLNTKKLSKKTIALRETIGNAKDPEKVFFEEFPRALGYSINQLTSSDVDIEDFVLSINGCIQEINQAYDNLLNRIENLILKKFIGKQLIFPAYKNELISRFSKIKKHQLDTKQKALLQRIKSPLDDRKSWINSVAFAVIGKSLENISDEEEKIFYDSLEEKIHELDNLCELSKVDIDVTNEEILKIEITSFVKGLEKRLIRLPKQNNQEILNLGNEIKSKLKGNSKDLNIALLTKLLQEQLNNE